jgi:hypothetical protein
MTQAPRRLDLESAADALPDWGFLAEPGAPEGDGPGYLLVALRKHPTLDHYDPEEVRFWVTNAGRGERFVLDRWTPMPLEREVSWGMIRIIDRVGASNEFLTFGGSVSAGRSEGTTVAAFVSPAPLLRRGGHSQGWDPGAQTLGAHFGRLVAVAGQDRAFEGVAAHADPVTRYAAFIADQLERGRHSEMVRDADPQSWRMFLSEKERLTRTDPARWRAGQALLASARSAVAAFG